MNPVGGSKIFIGLRVASKSEVTASDFVGQDWVEIGGLTNIGQLGDNQEVVSQAVISGGRTRQTKGTVVGQVMENTFLPIWNDPGQTRFLAAAKSCHVYAFKVEWSQGCEDDPLVDMFYGFALPGSRAGGDANSAQLRNWSIAVDSNVVEEAPIAFDLFINSITGEDSNAGSSSSEAWKTTGALLAYAASNDLSGKRVGFARGGAYDPMDLSAIDADDMVIGSYGLGDAPFFDCTTEIPASWTLHSSGVYKVTLNRANAGDAKLYGNYFRNGRPMRKVESVAALAGKGDNVVFAQNETSSNVTLYMNSPADPGTDGAAYRWSKYGWAISTTGRRNVIEDIWAHGPAHQDGSLRPVGDNGDKSTLGGNILRRCRMDWGARHSAVIGSGAFTSIVENCEFYGAANDIETGTVLNVSGTSNAMVFNSPDHTVASCISRNNTYDGLGYPNYNTGTRYNFTGPYGHDGVGGRPMVNFQSIGDTFVDMMWCIVACGSTNELVGANCADVQTLFIFNTNNTPITVSNLSGEVNRLFGEATVNGCTVTARNIGTPTSPIIVKDCGAGAAAWAHTMSSGSSASVDIDMEDYYIHITGVRIANTSRKLFAMRAGSLRLRSGVITPVLAPPVDLILDLASGVAIDVATDYNTYPKGANFKLGATTYYGLAAWKAASSRDASSAVHALPTPDITFDFSGADANFETLPGVARLNGVAGALQRKSNQLSAMSSTQSVYTVGDVSNVDQYVRFIVKGIAAVGGPGPALGVVDATNCLITRQTSTAHQIQSMIAGAFATPVNSATVAPAIGQEVIAIKRSYTDPDTGVSSLRVSLVVDDGLVSGLQLVTSSTIQAEDTVGAVARATTQDPLLDDLQYGPAPLAWQP